MSIFMDVRSLETPIRTSGMKQVEARPYRNEAKAVKRRAK